MLSRQQGEVFSDSLLESFNKNSFVFLFLRCFGCFGYITLFTPKSFQSQIVKADVSQAVDIKCE